MGVEVVVALLAGGFAIVVALIQRGQKKQDTDHGIVRDSLNRIETKLDGHISDHD